MRSPRKPLRRARAFTARPRGKQLTKNTHCHIIIVLRKHVALAQLDRASGYGPEGRGFESLMLRQEKPAETCGLFLCPCPRYSQPNAGRDCAQWRTIAVPSLRSLRIPRQVRECEQSLMLRQEKPAETCGFFCCFEKIKRKRDKPQSRRDLPRERRRCAAGSRVSLRRKCVRGCSRCPIFRRCRQRRLSCGSPCRDIRRRHPWSFRPWCKRFCTPRLCCPSPP